MVFSLEELLRPVTDAQPLGENLRERDEYDTLRTLTVATDEVNWARVHETAMTLARMGRDLRVWVWLTRAVLATDGIAGLAAGLWLIAKGLERHWDTLPPLDEDSNDPRVRFLARIAALGTLGMTSFLANRAQLMSGGTTVLTLAADVDIAVRRLVPEEASHIAVEDCRTAIAHIEETIGAGFRALNPKADAQVSFEIILGRLAAADGTTAEKPPAKSAAEARPNGHDPDPRPVGAVKAVASRDDVERVLDMVLEYYGVHEPASPVPLLVGRARRLVRMSFLDVLKDLAPGSMKEIEVVAGLAGQDRK